MYNFLKKIPLFADLPDGDLERLCQMVEDVHLPAGAELFTEGSMGDRAYVIKEGQIDILKNSAGREVLLAIRKPGDVIGEMSLLEAAPRIASGRARVDSELIAITQEQLENLLHSSTSAARAMLHTFVSRLRSTEILLRQSEKMAQLGTLVAGMAHELNNPAAAAKRGAEQLRSTIDRLQKAQARIDRLNLDAIQQERLQALMQGVRQRAAEPSGLDTLDRSDRETELEAWLEQQGIQEPWEVSPGLVSVGIDLPALEALAKNFPNDQFYPVVTWLSEAFTVYSLVEEIDRGAGRISEVVQALKRYVYLDQAPIQAVDINDELDNTLILLRNKLKSRGVTIRREYSEELPKIQAHGSELNQIWTNLLDNAADALKGRGEIYLRTRQEADFVVVSVEDNGPGIPENVQSRIFDPFFTTKPPGQGSGLGLNISYNIVQKHGGEIKVFSRPGKTIFEVWLPINGRDSQSAPSPVPAIPLASDETLLGILETAKTIAVVGVSDREDRPAYSVPAYLQSQGYRILPVNPNLKTVLGEKAYPDLLSIPEAVDVVLIFRRSEVVPPIIDQAIQINARVVWMQEGIINEKAAMNAQLAGLTVVMDACMRAQHKRLIGSNR